MGSVCSCLCDESEEISNPNSPVSNPNSPVYSNCICLGCLLPYFSRLCTSLFVRQDQHALPSSAQGTASLSSDGASLDNSLSDIYRSPPRPLPYDVDPGYYRLQRDGLVSRREKGSSHSHEVTEPLSSEVDEPSESLGTGGKWNESIGLGESKEHDTRSLLKLSTTKETAGFAHLYYSSSSDDEDVCPTCLDDYTAENPKITTNCSHHFHLSCIYEWMERSESCPVCGEVMAFDESP